MADTIVRDCSCWCQDGRVVQHGRQYIQHLWLRSRTASPGGCQWQENGSTVTAVQCACGLTNLLCKVLPTDAVILGQLCKLKHYICLRLPVAGFGGSSPPVQQTQWGMLHQLCKPAWSQPCQKVPIWPIPSSVPALSAARSSVLVSKQAWAGSNFPLYLSTSSLTRSAWETWGMSSPSSPSAAAGEPDICSRVHKTQQPPASCSATDVYTASWLNTWRCHRYLGWECKCGL
jgi:hypothetical protein